MYSAVIRRSVVGITLIVAVALQGGAATAQGSGAKSSPGATENALPSQPPFMPPGYNPGEMLNDLANPVVAEVEGHAITLAEIGDAIRALPTNMRNLPFEELYPGVLERLVQEQALVAEARRMQLDSDPVVRRHMREAEERVLENELLNHLTDKTITEEALLARYRQKYADKPGPEEVDVSVILVPTEELARKDLAEIAKGADFATIAKRDSKDTSADKGGALGFMQQDKLIAEVGAVAFSLDPGQVAPNPVHVQTGWFIVKISARRRPAAPTFAEVREDLRHVMLQEGVARVVKDAMASATVERFNMNGAKPMQSVDGQQLQGETKQ
jgi:peptidyl-prolyl cis-trans isomerase C